MKVTKFYTDQISPTIDIGDICFNNNEISSFIISFDYTIPKRSKVKVRWQTTNGKCGVEVLSIYNEQDIYDTLLDDIEYSDYDDNELWDEVDYIIQRMKEETYITNICNLTLHKKSEEIQDPMPEIRQQYHRLLIQILPVESWPIDQ